MRMNRLIALICILIYIDIVSAEKVQIGDLVYELNDKDFSAVVVGHDGVSGNLVIPATVSNNGIYSVTGIRMGAFSGCTDLTGVELPSSLISIGNRAFEGCSGLNAMVIPDAVDQIGEKAFEGCVGIKNLVIGESVKNVGLDAFSSCSNIQLLEYNAVDCVFEYKFNDSAGSIIELPEMPIFNENIPVVKIGEKVKNIPAYFLIKNKTIKNIEIPNSVETIDSYAFYRCGLKELVIPSSVTTIGTKAFYYNPIKTLTFEDGENEFEIKDRAFYNCPVETLYLGRIQKNQQGFGGMPLKEVVIGDLVRILRSRFINCKELTKVEISNSVTVIESSVFSNCTSLSQINLPDNLLEIKDSTFENCSSLTHINLPKNIVAIGDYAFAYCSNLKEINLPEPLEKIGKGAFNYCSSFKEIRIPASLKEVGYGAFANCTSLERVDISDLEAWFNIYFPGKTFEYVECSANPLFYAHHLYLNGEEVIDLVIPESITEIKPFALFGANSIRTVALNSEKEITIEFGAFLQCYGLTDFYCNVPNPPKCRDDTFYEGAYYTVKLHVPSQVRNLYKSDKIWGKFKDIEGFDYKELHIVAEGSNVMLTGASMQLYLQPIKNDFIRLSAIWISSDPTVITVDQSGVATAVAEGTAVVTAVTEDALYATLEITVKDSNGVDAIPDYVNTPLTVFSIDGKLLIKDGTKEDVIKLKRGLYIVNGKKIML